MIQMNSQNRNRLTENKLMVAKREGQREGIGRKFGIGMYTLLGLLGGASGKEPACQNRRLRRFGFYPWVRKVLWKRIQYSCSPLQYSCLKNPMDRGVWWAAVHGVVVGHD